ncbi:OprO/OprP family phosphate-selective porin [Aquisphaera insulae]|uniref:OprO/OprP family phosphate-selective porin n=1 Tax=Aquisphaera insulae TaxID=2712864 RepID=UPI0013EBE0D4|nr:porin [Aquisphaera insulae]
MGRWTAFIPLAALAVAWVVAANRAQADDLPSALPAAGGGDALEVRLRKLEALNQQILNRLEDSERAREASQERYRKLEERYDELTRKVEGEGREAEPWGSSVTERAGESATRGEGSAGREASRGQTGKRRGSGQGFDSLPEREQEIPIFGALGEGFTFKTRDDEYQLRVRVLDQTDFKNFVPGDQVPARSGLYIPRVRVYWEGQLTRLFEYEVSIQRSVEGLWDLLDGNVNIVPDRRFQVRFGRMLVPYSYDWYDHLEQYFITPERSLFPLNFGLSRSAGLMAHGFLFDDRLEYAAGGFDGHLTGLADDNTTRDAVGYLNYRPFLHSEQLPLLRNLNVGASGFLGQQVNPLNPLPLRTSIQTSENDEAAQAASSIFLKYNEDARNFGGRSATALHLAWYGAGFSFEAEWQGGRDHITRPGLTALQSIPVSGNHFTLAYFLTGEVVNRREVVAPLRPFDPIKGEWGPGAIEPFVRYSQLSLGDTIFTGGFADPNEWTRSIDLVDLGVNWYLTKYIKVYFDWQHSMYGTPVLLNPSKDQYGRTNDLFWIRGQLYF